MRGLSPSQQELRPLVRLALPVVAAQLGIMLFGVVDAWMVGRLGSRELAAVGLADIVLWGTLVLGFGFVMGIDPLVTQAHGAGDGDAAGRALHHGLVITLVAALPITVGWFHVETLLLWFQQDPELARVAGGYARAQSIAVLPQLVFMAFRQYLNGRGHVMPTLIVVLAANILNVGLNELLIFGRLGLPALGVHGAGLATGMTRVCLAAGLVVVCFRGGYHRGAWPAFDRRSLDPAGLRCVAGHGWPIAVQNGLEVWAFQTCMIMAGWLGGAATAVHYVVIRYCAIAFMVPLGLSIAAATRVGNHIGARAPLRAQRAAYVALALGGGVMVVSAICFLAFPRALASFFLRDEAVLALAVTVFPAAAAFQVFDGVQVVGCGILRGMGTTRPVAVINLVAYYGLAIPLGYVLAFQAGLGMVGLWWGLGVGLGAVAVGLVVWIVRRGPTRRSLPAPGGDR